MNDFTKEELQTINEECHRWHGVYGTESNKKLLNKIQSMIDNYCEHDWENICCQCAMDQIYCHKCKKRFNELKYLC